MKKIVLLVCFLSCLLQLHAQLSGDYQSTGAVTLTSATNWQVYNGTSWVTATLAPNGNVASGNTITIKPTHAWTNLSAATIPVGVTLLFQGTTTATTDFTANTLVINGTYIHNSPHGSTAGVTSQMAHVFTAVNSSTGLGANSTIVARGSASFTNQPLPSFGGRTYNNLTFDIDALSGSNTITATNSPGSPWTINGTLTVTGWANASFSGSASLATVNGDIVINAASKLTVANMLQANAAKTITINSGGTLGTTATYTLTVNGTLDNKSTNAIATSGLMVINNIYKHNADANTIPKTGVTYATNSTIQVLGIVSNTSVVQLPTACYNVLWNCTGQLAAATNTFFSGTPTTINGDFTVQSTGAGAIYIGGGATSRTLNVVGNLNIATGANFKLITSATATVNQICNVTGNVNITGGSFLLSDVTTGSTGVGQLNITGSLNHTAGTFGVSSTAVANSGLLTFTGNNTGKTIATTGFANALNVVVDKTSTGFVSLASNMSMAPGSTLTISSGSLKLNGFATTLRSTSASNSARVYVSSGAAIDQSISGSKFTVEQFIPGGTRAYRFLGHPFNAAINLSELTDDIDITGNDGNAAVAGTGFSPTATNNASAYWYDPTTGNGNTSAGWVAFTRNDGVAASIAAGSTSNTWNVGQGIRVLVRGPKGQPNILTATPAPNDATINMSGTINDGSDVTVNLTKGTNSGYNLISNPYCAPLDMYQFRTANSNANASSGTNFYIWVPTGGVNGKGQYIAGDMTASGETYRYLPAYSSFFVNVAANTTATFKEAHKAMATQNAAYNLRTSTTSVYGNNTLQLQLSRNGVFEDRLLLFFNNDKANAAYDATDALKLDNSNLNFYTVSQDGKHLAIDRRPLDKTKDVLVPLGFVTSMQATYSIDATDMDIETGTLVLLHDKFLNKEVPLIQGSSYVFDVTADNASQGENRFELVLKTVPPIAVMPAVTEFEVRLSPNPATDILSISFNNKEKANTTIAIVNTIGQVMQTIDAGNVQAGKINVDVKKWTKGSYYVTLTSNNEKLTQKLQVQ